MERKYQEKYIFSSDLERADSIINFFNCQQTMTLGNLFLMLMEQTLWQDMKCETLILNSNVSKSINCLIFGLISFHYKGMTKRRLLK